MRQVLSRTADQTVRFGDLCALLRRQGFTERHRGGSHHIFTRSGVREILNLQARPDGTAKPYQVKQVRELIERYPLPSLDNEDVSHGR